MHKDNNNEIKSQKEAFGIVIRGICVGGTMLVPGVSGGSMAMILGIYDRLIVSVSSFIKHKKASILFLSLFSISGLIGIFLFASPLLKLIERYPKPMLYFFIGAVAGGIPLIYKKAMINKISWKVIGYPVLGFLIVFLFSMLPSDVFLSHSGSMVMEYLLLIVAGIIAAIALVLPGISVSYMLLIMGLYDKTMKAIGECYLPYLVPLGIGLLLGIIVTTKLLEQAMVRYPKQTYLTILGFVLGSLIDVFPGVPIGKELIICVIMVIAGFLIIRLISKWEDNTIA